MTEERLSPLEDFLARYLANVVEGFEARWESYTPEIYQNEISEAIWGLGARQATLAVEMARNLRHMESPYCPDHPEIDD